MPKGKGEKSERRVVLEEARALAVKYLDTAAISSESRCLERYLLALDGLIKEA